MSAFQWEGGVWLLGPLARLRGLRASGTFRCLYSFPHRIYPGTAPYPPRFLTVEPLIGYQRFYGEDTVS